MAWRSPTTGRSGKRADPYYRSAEWAALRRAALERDWHRCTMPDCGRTATHVDHRVARSSGGTDDLRNLRSLCHGCHSAKTARQDGGFGNGPSRRRAIGPDGWPIGD